jgi:hypothetical protein
LAAFLKASSRDASGSVRVDRRHADVQRIGDFLIEIAAREQFQNFALARGKIVRLRWGRAEPLEQLGSVNVGNRSCGLRLGYSGGGEEYRFEQETFHRIARVFKGFETAAARIGRSFDASSAIRAPCLATRNKCG